MSSPWILGVRSSEDGEVGGGVDPLVDLLDIHDLALAGLGHISGGYRGRSRRGETPPSFMARITTNHTVLPSMRRNPVSRSSSSVHCVVDTVELTLEVGTN